MINLGLAMIALSTPLFIGYFIDTQKSKMWLYIGFAMCGVGVAIMLIPQW